MYAPGNRRLHVFLLLVLELLRRALRGRGGRAMDDGRGEQSRSTRCESASDEQLVDNFEQCKDQVEYGDLSV